MKFKGKATPKKGIDKGIKTNQSNLTIKLPMTDLMIYQKSLIITDKYLPKIRALYYAIIVQ